MMFVHIVVVAMIWRRFHVECIHHVVDRKSCEIIIQKDPMKTLCSLSKCVFSFHIDIKSEMPRIRRQNPYFIIYNCFTNSKN